MAATVARTVHVLYVVGQDEDGAWCASAHLRPGVGAAGDGLTRQAAIADLEAGLGPLIRETGAPDELTITSLAPSEANPPVRSGESTTATTQTPRRPAASSRRSTSS
jgi:hypothetical protein